MTTITKRKIAVKPITARRLRKICKHILEEPKRLFMEWWGMTYSDEQISEFDVEQRLEIPPCKTVGCIAGWASAFWGHVDIEESGVISGTNALHLQSAQANRLFYTDRWPESFMRKYEEVNGENFHRDLAQVTVDRIEHFIKTGGQE